VIQSPRLLQLTRRLDGAILAVLRRQSGEELEVVFTTAQKDGITVASPNPAIFDEEPHDAESVRALVAAVIAFDRVSSDPTPRRD
jgi:hypothetical protein